MRRLAKREDLVRARSLMKLLGATCIVPNKISNTVPRVLEAMESLIMSAIRQLVQMQSTYGMPQHMSLVLTKLNLVD